MVVMGMAAACRGVSITRQAQMINYSPGANDPLSVVGQAGLPITASWRIAAGCCDLCHCKEVLSVMLSTHLQQ
jgi:hypothetical protein